MFMIYHPDFDYNNIELQEVIIHSLIHDYL